MSINFYIIYWRREMLRGEKWNLYGETLLDVLFYNDNSTKILGIYEKSRCNGTYSQQTGNFRQSKY